MLTCALSDVGEYLRDEVCPLIPLRPTRNELFSPSSPGYIVLEILVIWMDIALFDTALEMQIEPNIFVFICHILLCSHARSFSFLFTAFVVVRNVELPANIRHCSRYSS
jgi:hypothetical protein